LLYSPQFPKLLGRDRVVDGLIQRKTFERIDRTKERNKTDIRATTCNPLERKFNNPFERE